MTAESQHKLGRATPAIDAGLTPWVAALVAFLCFSPVLAFDFVNWDD